ncbi:glycerophosphodiester phosphodiesterase [Desulfurispirillum indicum]|uniref:glycerophosphodiester phosphodiesterase n=1 Tax=Desulfurispirillum indicum TaxID=936456 RepID=UPI001CFB9BAA|nr:glycerophosphodiester phosphodiesterase [Desulfurispirillum indicum]UCZ57304.1 glycerophosphodiester phosphodiesterase [Desulfurispirillum indicum]
MGRKTMILTALAGGLAILLVVLVLVAQLAKPAREHTFFTILEHRPAVIAHRGGALLWPENTLLAFRESVALGVDGLEFDVHMSADGVPMVIHDSTVDRTTNGSGSVSSLSRQQIQSLDAGYHFSPWHSPQTFPWRRHNVTIPTLEEVFREFPHVPMVIEIKQVEPDMVEAVGELILRYGRAERTLVASFSPAVMQAFRQRYPTVATGAIQREVATFVLLNSLFSAQAYTPRSEAFFVPSHVGRFPLTTSRFIANAQRRNIFVAAWTINETEELQRLSRRNIDALVTDRPDLALNLLERGQ